MSNWDHKKLTVGGSKNQHNNILLRTPFERFYISQLIKLYYSVVESRFSDTAAMNHAIKNIDKQDWKTIKTHFTPPTAFPVPKMNWRWTALSWVFAYIYLYFASNAVRPKQPVRKVILVFCKLTWNCFMSAECTHRNECRHSNQTASQCKGNSNFLLSCGLTLKFSDKFHGSTCLLSTKRKTCSMISCVTEPRLQHDSLK